MPVTSQYEESSEVRRKAQRTNDKNKLRVANLRGVDEAGDSFEDDGEAKGDEKHGIKEGT